MVAALIAIRELREIFDSRGAMLRAAIFVLVLPASLLAFFVRPAADRLIEDPARLAMLARLLLIQFGLTPIGAAMHLAATSFATEFEAETVVPLLASPLPARSIFLGKLGAALLIGLASGWLAQACLVALFEALTTLPFPLGVPQAVAAGGVVAGLGVNLIALAVLIGSRSRRIRPAQQAASLVFLPAMIGALVAGYRLSGVPTELIVLAVLGCAAAAVALLGAGVRLWRREDLLAQG